MATDESRLQQEIRRQVRSRLMPLLARYGIGFDELDDVMKWKPMVLVIGNYSSGKSTLINEFLGRETQRTGQAPTDDSFTVITAPETGDEERLVPGSTLVNDERLPFDCLKKYGEQFIAHFRMKELNLPFLRELAVIDSPGMLDSVTERDRGYEYMQVVGELARLADLVVLMFDPHKAGTIRETYTTIRNTLPECAGEDRIVFVMSRIDECDNLSDLLRSYGTLCWNLSQMTGRKDIPRIFLTFAPDSTPQAEDLAVWAEERVELKRRMLAAPRFRLSHMLHDIDRKANELRLVVEGVAALAFRARQVLASRLKAGIMVGAGAFLFLDLITKATFGLPPQPLLDRILGGTFSWEALLVPAAGFVGAVAAGFFWFMRISLPRLRRAALLDPEKLVGLHSEYRKNLWSRSRQHLVGLLEKFDWQSLWAGHQGVCRKIDHFVDRDLQEFYQKIRN